MWGCAESVTAKQAAVLQAVPGDTACSLPKLLSYSPARCMQQSPTCDISALAPRPSGSACRNSPPNAVRVSSMQRKASQSMRCRRCCRTGCRTALAPSTPTAWAATRCLPSPCRMLRRSIPREVVAALPLNLEDRRVLGCAVALCVISPDGASASDAVTLLRDERMLP